MDLTAAFSSYNDFEVHVINHSQTYKADYHHKKLLYTYNLNIKQTLLMSPSLQASTSDLSLSAVPAEEAAEAEPEVGAPPPGPVAPPPVAPPGGQFNRHLEFKA